MKTKPKKQRRAKPDLLTVAAQYLKDNGWEVLVIGGTEIHQEPGAFKYNYQFVVNFTGKKRPVKTTVQKLQGETK